MLSALSNAIAVAIQQATISRDSGTTSVTVTVVVSNQVEVLLPIIQLQADQVRRNVAQGKPLICGKY